MIRKAKPPFHVRAAGAYRSLRWILGITVCAIIAVSGASPFSKGAIAAEADPVQAIGRWERTDGGYVLELRNPTFDGRLAAAYFNPRPIHVSRSAWVLKDGNLLVLVELRDQGYPGSTYTLAYQQDTDRLVGIYYQAAAQQQFEVVFERIE